MRMTYRIAGCLLVWLLLTPALAAAQGHTNLNPVQVDYWQLGFTIAVFVLLLAILIPVAFRPILLGLQKREAFIRESLDSAAKDREAAQAKLREYEERLRQAREEAAQLAEQSRRDVEAMRRRVEEDARKSGEELLERARREIGTARDTALKALYEESANMAAALAASALKRQMTPEEHQRLVLDALRELSQRAESPN